MAKAWHDFVPQVTRVERTIDWRKRMSDNVAYALLTYTGLQIFMTMGALHNRNNSLLPYFALVMLVAAIIPSCRYFERRWCRLDETQVSDPCFARRFRRDRFWLWTLAIGLPFLVTGLFKGLTMMFGHA